VFNFAISFVLFGLWDATSWHVVAVAVWLHPGVERASSLVFVIFLS